MGVEPANPASITAAVRLEFVDGIRGFAALYIVLYHSILTILIKGFTGGLPALVYLYTAWMQFGNLAVTVFIVLSGFCLMSPVAATSDGRIEGGVGGFLKRRCRRILPAYYAGLVFASLLVLLLPPLATPQPGTWHSYALPVSDSGVLVSHALLVHNLNPAWALKISPSLWTIGTEFQLYLLFCFVLVPVWRRWGMLATVGAGFAVGLLPFLFVWNPLALPSPWYPPLFAIGMAAAMAAHSNGQMERRLRERISWSGICTVLCLVATLINVLGLENPRGSRSITNLVAGCALGVLLIHGVKCARGEAGGQDSGVFRLLRSPFACWLGVISYSLYVVHEPILRTMHVYLERAGAKPIEAFAVLLLCGVPTCIGAALLFFVGVEQRFRSRRRESAARGGANPEIQGSPLFNPHA